MLMNGTHFMGGKCRPALWGMLVPWAGPNSTTAECFMETVCASLWLLFQNALLILRIWWIWGHGVGCLSWSLHGGERIWVDRDHLEQKAFPLRLTSIRIFQYLLHNTQLQQQLLNIPQPSGFLQLRHCNIFQWIATKKTKKKIRNAVSHSYLDQ